MYTFDVELSPDQVEELARTDPKAWFASIQFANAKSPAHPGANWMEENYAYKRAFVGSWISRVVPGRRVIDTFCANGAFSFLCAEQGAKSVTGVDFEPVRIDVANLVTRMLADNGRELEIEFQVGDIYHLAERYTQPFDVTLCIGGLYHIPDPAYVLSQLRKVTGEWLILQTARVLPVPGNFARFTSRPSSDPTQGLSSLRAGSGVWYLSPGCLRQLLYHSGFEIVEERVPPLRDRKRHPWYAALARANG